MDKVMNGEYDGFLDEVYSTEDRVKDFRYSTPFYPTGVRAYDLSLQN